MAKAVSNKQDKSGKGKADRHVRARAPGAAKRQRQAGAQGPERQAAGARRSASAPRERRGLGKFLHDVRVEMGKVTWPTRQDLVQSTLVVLVAVAIAAAYTGVLDEIFSQVRRLRRQIIT